jgi:Mn-containing catalase
MSTGETDVRGPWNADDKFENVENLEPQDNNPAVDYEK